MWNLSSLWYASADVYTHENKIIEYSVQSGKDSIKLTDWYPVNQTSHDPHCGEKFTSYEQDLEEIIRLLKKGNF